MGNNNVVGIALDELYRIFDILNKKYFNGSLEIPIITIQKAKSSGNLGWFTLEKIWTDKNNEDEKYEINISAEHLRDEINSIVGTLLHEMVHYRNKTNDIKDCNGQIHNKKFASLAESVDLVVEKTKKFGFGLTSCSDRLDKFIEDEVKPDESCFQYFRSIILKPKDETEKKTCTYICPECEEKVRGNKGIQIHCVTCDCEFAEKE